MSFEFQSCSIWRFLILKIFSFLSFRLTEPVHSRGAEAPIRYLLLQSFCLCSSRSVVEVNFALQNSHVRFRCSRWRCSWNMNEFREKNEWSFLSSNGSLCFHLCSSYCSRRMKLFLPRNSAKFLSIHMTNRRFPSVSCHFENPDHVGSWKIRT